MRQLWTKLIYLILGKSPDDKGTEGTSLGRCPDSRIADRSSTEDCIEWKIAVGAFAVAAFALSILILIVTVSRYKGKSQATAQRDSVYSSLLCKQDITDAKSRFSGVRI